MEKGDKIKLGVLLLLWAVLFAPVMPAMVREWLGHSDNSHGFIVPLMAGYFYWQRRAQLTVIRPEPAITGGLLLACTLVVYVLSFAGGIAFTARVALVLSLFGMLWYCLGREAMRILAFPVLFLLFMIPVPYSLLSPASVPLQLFATKVSAYAISACSIPVYREGNLLFFTNTQLEVAEACSGIRSIMSLTMLAFAFTSMLRAGWGKKVILIASAVPIAMLANIIRITGTGVLAHFFGDKVARGFLHEFSGIVVFVFGFVVLLGIFTLINKEGC